MDQNGHMEITTGAIEAALDSLTKLIDGAKGTDLEKNLPALMSARAKVRKAGEALDGIEIATEAN